MKKNTLSIFALFLAVIMLLGIFASCGNTPTESNSDTRSSEATDSETENPSENQTDNNETENTTSLENQTSASEETSTSDSDTSLTETETTVTETVTSDTETVTTVTETETTLTETETSRTETTVTETETTDTETETTVTETETTDTETETTVTETETTVIETETTETETETTETETETTETESLKLSGEHAELVETADALKNGVTAYYTDGTRTGVVFENGEMKLDYVLSSDQSQLITSLANKNGNAYISDTMDVFVRMTDGDTYFASESSANAIFNIHRFGYYFYQMRIEGQDFIGNLTSDLVLDVNIEKPSTYDIQSAKYKGDYLVVKNATPAADPNLTFRNLSVDTSTYTIFEIAIKADEKTSAAADLFYLAGSATGFSGEQRIRFSLTTDGKWHTYHVPVYTGPDYTGTLSSIRLDISGSGAEYELKDAKFLAVDMSGVPSDLSLCRTFNVYSDKMYQTVQIATTKETSGIAEIGMLTKISADTVAKIILKDKNGIRDTLDGADMASIEYIGFDIKDAGIFGFILPYDGKGGALKVTLEEGVYFIEQTMIPENGTIIPSRTDYNAEKNYYNWVEGGNTNDIFMGQRIYTDENHDFAEFLEEAYCERNPLPTAYFKVNENSSTSGSSYSGYDSLRGIYVFNIDGAAGFSGPYYTSPNKHYRANFVIRGDDHSRKIYAMTYCSKGQLECAVLLDENDVLLPVPMEVGKNFSEMGGERNLYNLADFTYSETIFPLVINSKTKYEYTVLNLYQNWGNYPLKQISWIQFFSPYYHLSTGVTESNCIVPWTFTNRIWYNTLPDFRGMSAPLWLDQPQHTSAGDHDWLKYTDSEGNEVRAENIYNTIDSYGPTYADVKMDYITYDGKIKVTYTHTEMPQTDENRTYYEIKYEVLGDVTINDVVNNLQLYRVEPNDAGKYKKVGYLNESNESVVVDANETKNSVKYTLGNECPYFSFFDMDGHTNSTGYGNLAFLIYNSSFKIGGETATPSFAIVNHTDCVYVTLDLETLALKAGDCITINCILLPWGSQLLDDGIIDPENNNFEYTMELDDGTLYMDKNVRDVRENTLKNPLLATADKDCEVIESVYVPKLRTTNGESAEFTLGGGYNNVAVRVYGFSKMTVPVIYEKIGGEWVVYNVSSSESVKDAHKYDGYMIHYDGDGTFSYSFVTDMDGDNTRSFKIIVDGNYDSWKKETQEEVVTRPDHLNVYIDSVELAGKTDSLLANQFVSKSEVSEDESYVRFYGAGLDAKYGEGYVTAYKATDPAPESGKYLVVKYRLGANNAETVTRFDFFLSTTSKSASNDNVIYINKVKSDGEWHTLIIDLEKVVSDTFGNHFTKNDDGKYHVNFVRFDFFDRRMSEDSYIDIAFVGVDDSLEKIAELSQDCKTITLVEGSSTVEVDPETGEKIDLTIRIPEVLVDPSSGYTQSTLEYGSQIDNLNGVLIDVSGGSKRGVVGIMHNASTIADRGVTDSATVEGHNLVLSGWCVVEGGIDSYVWSADGGKTWNTLANYGRSPDTANEAIVNAAYARTNKTYQFTIETDAANGSFQGAGGKNPTGLCIDLEEYAGETVNIILGVIPAKDTSTVIPMYYIARVKVAK